MLTVYKYPCEPISDGYFELRLPRRAAVLHVAKQHNKIQLWALVDPAAPEEPRRFRIAATGDPITERVRFVGTMLVGDGLFVWHVFEVI